MMFSSPVVLSVNCYFAVGYLLTNVAILLKLKQHLSSIKINMC